MLDSNLNDLCPTIHGKSLNVGSSNLENKVPVNQEKIQAFPLNLLEHWRHKNSHLGNVSEVPYV